MIATDQTCPTCQRLIGEHLVSEWVTCAGTPWEDLAFEETHEPLTFSLEGRDIVVADTLTARAMVGGADGYTGMRIPILLLSFATGVPGSPPREVAEIALISSAETMRKLGVVLRDAANAAANKSVAR